MERDSYGQVEGEQLRWLRWGLARNPALPAAVMDQLIASGDDMVCLKLAERDDLGDDQVRALARTGDVGVIALLMRRGLMTPQDAERFHPQLVIAMADIGPVRGDWLHQVATDPDPALRAALASTAYRPVDIISTLADDPDLDVAAGTAESPGLPEPVAERLASHPHTGVRRAIACNERVPVRVLVAIAQRRPPAVERCPGCDPAGHWPAELWSCDGTHQDALDDLDYALTLNPRTPAEILDRFASHRSMHVRWSLASRPGLSPQTYQALAHDPVPRVRGDLAANPAIDDGLIRTMADDPTYDVRRRLAHNPAIPLDMLETLAPTAKLGPTLLPRIASATAAEVSALAASAVAALRMLVAERRDLPGHLVDRLAEDPDAKVLKSLAPNPALSVAQLRSMLAAHGPRVAAAVAANPSCPPELLLELARETPPVQKALRHIAEHPNAPAEALLACLGDPKARRVAARHPILPVRAVVELLADADAGEAAAANPSLPVTVMRDIAGIG